MEIVEKAKDVIGKMFDTEKPEPEQEQVKLADKLVSRMVELDEVREEVSDVVKRFEVFAANEEECRARIKLNTEKLETISSRITKATGHDDLSKIRTEIQPLQNAIAADNQWLGKLPLSDTQEAIAAAQVKQAEQFLGIASAIRAEYRAEIETHLAEIKRLAAEWDTCFNEASELTNSHAANEIQQWSFAELPKFDLASSVEFLDDIIFRPPFFSG